MQELEVNQRVRLTHGVPELDLDRGSEGVVQSVWFSPTPAYEVEFQPAGADHAARALLEAAQIELAAEREWEK